MPNNESQTPPTVQNKTSLPPGVLEAQIIQFPHSAASEDPEKSMAQREIQDVVEHAIDELPDAFRIVFITRVIEGMNVEETADILGLKPETVKTRLHRARAMVPGDAIGPSEDQTARQSAAERRSRHG